MVLVSLVWVILYRWAKHSNHADLARINSLLEWLSPLVFLLSMSVFVFGSIKRLRSMRSKLWAGSKNCTLLISILLVSAGFRLALIPCTERLYYDEHCYQQLAYGVAEEGRLRLVNSGIIEDDQYDCTSGVYPHWPPGWPTLLGIFWALTGYSRGALPFLNLTLSLLTLVFATAISWRLWPTSKAWAFTAACYGCLPDNLIWSLTSASETSSALWITLSFLCAIGYARTRRDISGTILVGSIAMAIYTRNELVILMPVCLLLVLSQGGLRAAKQIFWPGSMLITLLLPHSLHLGVTSKAYDHYLVIEETIFGLSHLHANLTSLLDHLAKEPVSLAILCLAFLSLPKLKSEKVILPLIIWIISIVFLSSFHFGARYSYPGGSRFIIPWSSALCLLAGYSLGSIHTWMNRPLARNILSSLVGLFFVLALIWSVFYGARSDRSTQIPRSDVSFLRNCLRDIPADSMVVCSNPAVLVAEGMSSVSLFTMMNNRTTHNDIISQYYHGLYLYHCPSLSPHQYSRSNGTVEHFLASYQTRIVREQADSNGKRSFYQLMP